MLAMRGVLMTSLSPAVVGGTLISTVAFALALDGLKFGLFKRLNMSEEE
jgi:hypothetical protein